MRQFLEPDSLVIRKSDDQRIRLINQTKSCTSKDVTSLCPRGSCLLKFLSEMCYL